MGGSWSSVFALNNDAEDLDATVDESGTVAQEQSYTAYDQQIVSTNAGAWSLNLNRGGYQDTETSFINTGGSGYVNPALGNFSTPSNTGFLGGNPTAMSPPEEEPGAELNLGPDLTWGSYGGRTQGLNRLARGMEAGLTFLSGFNPIYVAGGAILGQDAGGRKLSKGQRVFMGATLAAGPVIKGAGSAIGGLKGLATGVAGEVAAAEGVAREFEVGIYGELASRVKGMGLEVHHLPQAHLGEQAISGYVRREGLAIVLPRALHRSLPRTSRLTGPLADLSSSELRMAISHQLRDLSNAGVPKSALREIGTQMRSMYPGIYAR